MENKWGKSNMREDACFLLVASPARDDRSGCEH